MSAREDIAYLLWQIVPSEDDSKAKENAERMLDAHRAEVLAADGQAYDDELAKLRSLVDSLRVVVRHDGDLAEVWRLLVEYTQHETASREEATAAAATATPDFFQPGHRYAHSQWHFHCATVTTHPETGEQSAIGWLQISDGSWTTYAYSEAAWGDSWVDVTGAGDR